MLIATFIGINKHKDRSIRELSGAVRDATAFWALVSDSTTAECRLVVDADATSTRIREEIAKLEAAEENDVLILAFSGHGTNAHRLVAYDTDRTALETTTVGMEELAKAFKASKAKAILCIIDCCFSGAAPGRVLEDTPTARSSADGFELLTGDGRVLIAACDVNQVAYESPTTRHGFLTGALLDVLQNATDSVDILNVMSDVLDRVRAQASQMGLIQTPVMLGHVTGGLKIPRLVPGAKFFTAFPERRGARTTTDVSDLQQFGIPAAATAEWASRFSQGLNELQVAAVNEGRILDGESLVVVAPTSSGKTFIGEMAAAQVVTHGNRAVFLLPYRALVNEKFDSFQSLYGDVLGYRVIRCCGDYTDSAGDFVKGQYDLAVLTYEMFLSLVVENPSVLHSVGLVVLDESQFITDPTRGISVELLLTFIVAARRKGICPQLIALSAVIGNVNYFDEWLGCSKLVTDRRPVPLVEGVLDRNGTFQFVDVDGVEKSERLLEPYAIQQRHDKPSAQDVIVPLARQLLSGTTEKIIVFRNQRGAAEGCARYLAKDLDLEPATDALDQLPEHDQSSTSQALRACLRGGTAFHSTNLTREEKQVVERAFRDSAKSPRVLGATTTVAAGINTPASTVVIAEHEFLGDDGRQFTVAEYKNMAGRAGRLGFNEKGKSIIYAETAVQRQQLFQRYVLGKLEPLQSSFAPEDLDTWVVRLLAQVTRVERSEVSTLLLSTYGGYLSVRRDPSWEERTRRTIDQLLGQMLSLGLLEEELGSVQLSLLGRACGRSSLSFRSAMRLVELVRSAGASMSATDLMALVQALPEVDNWTPMTKRGASEQVRSSQASARYPHAIVRLLQRHCDDTFGFLARCKRASILMDWIGGVALDTIERTYSTTPFQGKIGYGDIRRFADSTRFHLRAAHQITNIVLMTGGPDQGSIDSLLARLEDGVPADALGLLAVSIPLDRGTRLALLTAGIRTPSDLWALTDQEIAAYAGTFASALLARRPKPSLSATKGTSGT